MTRDRNSKNRQTKGTLLALFAIASILFIPLSAYADSSGASAENTILSVLGPVVLGWGVALFFALKKPRVGVVVSAIGGLVVALYLASQHLSPEASSLCTVSATFDCNAVNLSKYGKLSGHFDFLPDYPISFLGAAFYVAVGLVGFLGIREPEKYKLGGQFVVFAAALSLVFSLELALVSHFSLKKWCLYCIGMYGFNALIFWSALRWAKESEGSYMDAVLGQGDRSSSSALTSFIVCVVIGVFMSGGGPSKVSGEWSLEKASVVPLQGTEPAYGPRDAKYTLVEFADFECPHCAEATPGFKEVIDDLKNAKLLFKHYPLSSKCNPNLNDDFHKDACEAALATECADKQGKFWKMNHLIFVNYTHLGRSNIDYMAQQARLDMDKFKACMDAADMSVITQDIKDAESAGVSGTPSLYIRTEDGKKWYKITDRETGLRSVLSRLKSGETLPETVGD